MADQISSSASLLSSIAAVLSAVAWPAITFWFLAQNRKSIAELLKVIAHKLGEAKKVKVGIFELESTIEEEITKAGAEVSQAGTPKAIPLQERLAADELQKKIQNSDLPEESILDAVRAQIYSLATEYDSIRNAMPSGPMRTRRMNEIVAGMRRLAATAAPLRTELTTSSAVGRRLAAICILQVEPRPRYFKWLVDRVKTENQAFVLFQASIAILEAIKKGFYVNSEEAQKDISDAIKIVSSFQGGVPDKNTLDALNEALNLLSK